MSATAFASFRAASDWASRSPASRSAARARTIPTEVPTTPATRAARTSVAARTAPRCRFTNFPARYQRLGGPAVTGSSARWRRTSAASPFAVSYRREGSFSRHFSAIQPTSPRSSFSSRPGSVPR
ncbi:MAG: hypothetical protein IPP07_24745 [Holophagales bacterium]|nr:hypothetical protein [Holophagales bacterium]MBK9967908.1 hypothetical protein [Holophagales bacterium]